jgi:tetratricopeptide (TPR) repeat protein
MGEERSIPAPPLPRRREREILTEIPSVLGLVLWQEARHLRDWAETPVSARGVLFPSPPLHARVLALRRQARAEAGDDLTDPLTVFQRLLTSGAEADPRQLASACEKVALWAIKHEHVETAIEYAEAAAITDPLDAKRANLAGRLTRNAHENARAEIWFRRGIGLARLQRDKIELARGHLGRGILYQEMGRLRSAKKHMHTGARVARSQGLDWLAAEAEHDLMLLLAVHGRHAEAEQHAKLALRWYGSRHARFPLFAADIALLLVFERNYHDAARLARGALRHIEHPASRSVVLALLARALVGAGFPDELDRLRRRVVGIVKAHREREAVALWHLAAAERAARRWVAAEESAGRSLAIALRQGDRETSKFAARLLTAIQARKLAPPPGALRKDPEYRSFYEELSARLSKWSPERRALSAVRSAWVA